MYDLDERTLAAGWTEGNESQLRSNQSPDILASGRHSPATIQVFAEPTDVPNTQRLVARLNGEELASVNICVMPVVFDLEAKPGMLTRKAVDALFFYGQGYVKTAGFDEAMLLVKPENEPMQKYAETIATEDPGKLYIMSIR